MDDKAPVTSKAAAQARADDIRAFSRELARLQDEGALSLDDGQRSALAAHHARLLAGYAQGFDIDRDARAAQLSLGMRVASFLGALALAASVFFLFYRYWGLLPTPAQVGILVGAVIATLAGTLWIQSRDRSGYFAKLAALVTFACFVLNVVMVGQIFNITPSDNALLPWAAFAFLLAYTCDLRLLLVAGILCLVAWVAARTGTWDGIYWLDFGRRPENFFPVAIALFCFPQWVDHAARSGFAMTYRVCGLLALLLPVLVLAHWGEASYLDLDRGLIEGSYQLAGFALSALAVWLGVRRNWQDTVNTGIVFFVVFLYSKFFDWWWDSMPKYLFFLVLGMAAVLVLLVLRRLRAAAGRAQA